MAATVRAALQLCRSAPELRQRLARLTEHAGHELEQRCGMAPSGSQILPVIVGADQRALVLAAAMREAGFDVRAIRPPTVPEGTARLRLAITLNVDEATVSNVMTVLADALSCP